MLSAKLHTAAMNTARNLKFVTLAMVLLAFGFTGCSKCSRSVDEKDTTLNVYSPVNIKGMDPIRADDLYSSTVIQQVFDGLLQYHYLKRPLELEPALADGMPTVSNNGLTHTFKIKKGVKFHDNACFPEGKGRELVAQDFVYSFKRLADPKNASQGFWIFDGYIKGLNEWADAMKTGKATYDTAIAGLETPDSHTLVIHLTKPYYQLYYVLAMGFAAAIPKEAIDKYGEEFLNNPVGTGPYMLKNASDWVRNSKLTLQRNPTYREELYPSEGEEGDKEAGLLADAGKKLPFADTVVFNEIIESQPRFQNFMKGKLEFLEIPKDNFETVVTKEDRNKLQPDLVNKGIRLSITPNVDITYIGFNMRDPILGKSKAIRHALTLSQDTKTLIDKFYNGRGIIAQSPIPPGISGYDPA
ncbi:MAG TPA: ABC transporter substrate-binding protein, partial [Bdellovibrionales bacterium]|nr:ABC transporter substrate-binding protein [Bdellovibrionales bacterium]